MEHDERLFVKFTDEQMLNFRQAFDNKRIVVNGPAGSGKTIIAKEVAMECLEEEKRVLFLCFNKTLSAVNKGRFGTIIVQHQNRGVRRSRTGAELLYML